MSVQGKTSPARLLVVDDHAVVREGLRTVLAGEPNFDVVGEAANGREALELCRHLRPDLVLMDVKMPEMDGLAAAQAIKAESSAKSILMLTTYEDPHYLVEAVKAGAAGYVLKDATKQELISATRRALNGENPLNQELAMQLLRSLTSENEQKTGAPPEHEEQPQPLSKSLTAREREVLQLLAQGQTNRQISQELVVSTATVKVHVEHVIAKLGVSNRTEAALWASEAGLLLPKKE